MKITLKTDLTTLPKIYNFKTISMKNINDKFINTLEKTINRTKIIFKINDCINDIKKSGLIENSIFEYSIIYLKIENIDYSLFESIYNDKVNDIIWNLDSKNNKDLILQINNDSVNLDTIAFLNPNELNKDSWKFLLEKQEMKKFREENMSTTDAYYCKKCGAKKSRVYQMQTRSADEPMTTFVTCLKCFNTFKF
jgi:DNA-directed RNA polymerase subunit M/transcription elongation factor TFIIS